MAPTPPVAVTGGAAAAAAPAQPAKSSNVLKIVLIVVAVIAVLAIGGMAVAGYMVKRAINNAVKTDSSGTVTSVNIGGTKIETLTDSRHVAEKIGVEIFPGAQAQNDGAGSFTIGAITTTHAQFSTSASPDEVFEFYKGKYPDATIFDQPESKMLTQGTEDRELLTINVAPEDGKTMIHIQQVTKGK
jgi:Tfp pilus assembly major pilin PilA